MFLTTGVAHRRQRRAAGAEVARRRRTRDLPSGAALRAVAGNVAPARLPALDHLLARLHARARDIAATGATHDVFTRASAGALDLARRRAGARHTVAAGVIRIALHVARPARGARDVAVAVRAVLAIDDATMRRDHAARALRRAPVAVDRWWRVVVSAGRIDILGARHDAKSADAIAPGVTVGGLRAGVSTTLVGDRTTRCECEHQRDLNANGEDELHGRPP